MTLKRSIKRLEFWAGVGIVVALATAVGLVVIDDMKSWRRAPDTVRIKTDGGVCLISLDGAIAPQIAVTRPDVAERLLERAGVEHLAGGLEATVVDRSWEQGETWYKIKWRDSPGCWVRSDQLARPNIVE